jgi:hypothetical protein
MERWGTERSPQARGDKPWRALYGKMNKNQTLLQMRTYLGRDPVRPLALLGGPEALLHFIMLLEVSVWKSQSVRINLRTGWSTSYQRWKFLFFIHTCIPLINIYLIIQIIVNYYTHYITTLPHSFYLLSSSLIVWGHTHKCTLCVSDF